MVSAVTTSTATNPIPDTATFAPAGTVSTYVRDGYGLNSRRECSTPWFAVWPDVTITWSTTTAPPFARRTSSLPSRLATKSTAEVG